MPELRQVQDSLLARAERAESPFALSARCALVHGLQVNSRCLFP
jgi:hypothetical protein